MKNTGIKNCVYLIRCPKHSPGLVKIGLTTDLDSRMNSLNGATETPVPFDIYCVVKTDKYHQLETHLHHIYAGNRTNPKREFFEFLDEDGNDYIDDVVDMMSECAELVDGEFVDFRDEVFEKTPNERRRRFSFKACGIKPGEEVTFDCDKYEGSPQTYFVAANGCHLVADKADIEDKDTWQTVSSIVQEITHRPNYWSAMPECWYYKGKNCSDLFEAAKT